MDENNIPQENSILFHLTIQQAELLANHYGKELNFLNEYEICELLDQYIDELS